MRHRILNLFLIIAISVSVVGQQKRLDQSAPSVERLRAHITLLASDKLDGRRAGTVGADEAARYIAGEFERYKLRPEFASGALGIAKKSNKPLDRYMQWFPFVTGVELGKNNAMLFIPRASTPNAATPSSSSARTASLDLRLQEDWMPLGFSANARAENAPAVFVGYGITAADLNHDDYAGADVSGRIAIALAGTPDNDNPHGQFARYADVRWKAVAARDHGAKALVIIAREENFRDDRLARLSYDNSAGDAGLPVVAISRQTAGRILEAGGLAPLTELEKAVRHATRSNTSAPASGNAGESSVKIPSAPLQNIVLNISTDIVRRDAPSANVIGVLEGSDPKLKTEAIVIGAHYDHLGRGGSGSLAAREGEVHHGADDNASGVAGLLELARTFSAEGAPKVRRTIIFIAFGAEEEGLIGSNYYINHPVMPLSQTVAMINMDMIGRMKENRLIVGGVGTSDEWREWLSSANLKRGMQVTAARDEKEMNQPTNGVPIVTGADGSTVVSLDPTKHFSLTLNEDGYGPSDHASFYAKRIPVLHFWTGTHKDYHKPSDTSEKINYEGEAKILSFIADIVRAVDSSDARPKYAVAKSEGRVRTTGFRVYLGTVPVYAESTDGLVLDAVREDSPAAKAGLKASDKIVKLAGREVRNVYDYTYALGQMKAGVEYEVEVMRGSERLTLKITPAARK